MKSIDPKKLRNRMIKLYEEKLRYFREWEWKILSEEEACEKSLILKGYVKCLRDSKIIRIKEYTRLIRERDYTIKKVLKHFQS